MYKYGKFYIPEEMLSGIEKYVNNGVIPNSFLKAIICNDLRETIWQASPENLRNLPAYIGYFYNEVPGNCTGSEAIMLKYIEKIRLQKAEMSNARLA